MEDNIINNEQNGQQEPPVKVSVKDFAQKIKAKYPVYKDIDDKILTDKIIAKYPVYKDQVDFGEEDFPTIAPIPKNGAYAEKKRFTELWDKANITTGLTQSEASEYANLSTKLGVKAEGISWGMKDDISAFGQYPTQQQQPNPIMGGGKRVEQSEFEMNSPLSFSKRKRKSEYKPEKINISNVAASTSVSKPLTEIEIKESIKRGEKIKEKEQIAIDNTTEKKLKIMGIKAPKGTPLYNEQRQKIQKLVDNGDATYHSKDGVLGLDRTIGFWEGVSKGWNEAVNGNDEADDFTNTMTTEQQVEFANRKAAERPTDEYLDERDQGAGTFLGGAGPFLAKATIGTMAGTAMVAAAPETAGASLAGLPAVTAFAMTAYDMQNQGATNETLRRFNILKQQNPNANELDLMKQAKESGTIVGGIGGLVENMVFMRGSGGLMKAPITAESKNIIKDFAKGTIKAGLKMGATTAGVTAGEQIEGNIEGYNTKAEDIASATLKSFEENATVGMILHGITSAVTGAVKMPKALLSSYKNALKDVPTENIREVLSANEQQGNIPKGATEQVIESIDGYKEALAKTAEGLTPEAKASVAGLIQAKDNLIAEMETKDETQRPLYEQKIEALNKQIENITKTNDPLKYEIDEVTGEPLKEPTPPIIEGTAEEISKPVELSTEVSTISGIKEGEVVSTIPDRVQGEVIEYDELPQNVKDIVDKYGDANDKTEFNKKLEEAGYGTDYSPESFGQESDVTFYKLPKGESQVSGVVNNPALKEMDLSKDNAVDFEVELTQANGLSSSGYKRKGNTVIRIKNHTPDWANFNEDVNDAGVKKIVNVTVGDFENSDSRRNKQSLEDFKKENPDVEVIDINVAEGESLNDIQKKIQQSLLSKEQTQEVKGTEGKQEGVVEVKEQPKEKINEPTTEVTEPISKTITEPKEQGVKEGVQQGAEPMGDGAAETTNAILKTKEIKIKEFNEKADKAAKDLIDFLTPKTTRGATTKGLTIADLVTGANEVIKSTYATSLNIKEAVEAGIKHFKDNWNTKEFGTLPEDALREKLLKQMEEEAKVEGKERAFTKQMLETEDLSPESKAKVKETLEYVEQTNAMSAKEAEETINKLGVDESFSLIMDRNNNVNGAVRATIAQAVIKKYNDNAKNAPDEATKNYYLDKTIEAATFVTEKLATDAGQQIQAFSMWERLSPEAQLRASVKDMKKQGDKAKTKIKKDVDKIGDALQEVNNVVAEQITQKGKTKSAAERLHGRIAKKGQDKVAKAREARANILKKYQADKGKNLYAGIGLTKEGIEFVGNMAKTYLDEGIGRAEIIAEKILKHLQEVTGKTPNDEVIRNVNDIAQTHALKAGDVKIAKGVKDIENEINKIVKEHYTVKEESKKSLINKFIDKLGLEKEEATQLAKEIQTEFDNIASRKKGDILDREIRRLNKIKSKQLSGAKVERRQVQDEIIKFSNLGAFDNGKLLDVIAERLGIGKVSPAEAAKIIELANKIQEAPIGSPKTNATVELLKYRANLKGTNWGEVAQGVWYANILSGYATHVRNIVSTFYNTLSFAGVEAISNPRAVPFLMLGMSKGLTKGLSEAYHTLVTGETPIHIAKIEIPDILERTRFKGGLLNPANWFKFVGRAMKAEDVLLFQGLKEMRATQLAYKEANMLGLKNPLSKKTYQKVNELLFNTKERLEIADEQIKQEKLTGIAAMRRRYELMEMSRPQEMTDAAYGFAAKGTFNHNTEGTLGALSDAISGFLDNSLQVGGTKPLRFLVPFTRIITNVANNSLDFSPIGLVRGAVGKRGLLASEASGKRIEMTPEERRQTIIKASLGIATMATAYALSKNGIIQITGAGPSNIDKKLQLIEEGWQPFSIKIGDTYYSYKLTPMVFGLGVIGSIRDHEEYDKDVDEDTLTDRIGLTLYNSMKLITDMTWVSSAAPIMAAISSDNSNKATSILSNSIKNSAKSFLMPNLYTQGAQKIEQMFGIPQKEANNFGQLLIKDIPIARNFLNNRINSLGDEVIKDVDLLKSKENPDPVWKYLLDKKGWVAPVNKNTLTVFDSKIGEDRPVTEDEYYEFSKTRGKKIKSKIEDFISGKTKMIVDGDIFNPKTADQATSAELNKWLSGISSQATIDAKADLFEQIFKIPKISPYMQIMTN